MDISECVTLCKSSDTCLFILECTCVGVLGEVRGPPDVRAASSCPAPASCCVVLELLVPGEVRCESASLWRKKSLQVSSSAVAMSRKVWGRGRVAAVSLLPRRTVCFVGDLFVVEKCGGDSGIWELRSRPRADEAQRCRVLDSTKLGSSLPRQASSILTDRQSCGWDSLGSGAQVKYLEVVCIRKVRKKACDGHNLKQLQSKPGGRSTSQARAKARQYPLPPPQPAERAESRTLIFRGALPVVPRPRNIRLDG